MAKFSFNHVLWRHFIQTTTILMTTLAVSQAQRLHASSAFCSYQTITFLRIREAKGVGEGEG